MKRTVQIKGYTRTVNGKSVKVRAYSRTIGKGRASSAKAGEELTVRKAERKLDPKAMTPSGLTLEEWNRMNLEEARKRELAQAPAWRRRQIQPANLVDTPSQTSSTPGKAGKSSPRLSKKEFEQQAIKANAIRMYQSAPKFAREKLLKDPHIGKILQEHFSSRPTVAKATPKVHKYSSEKGLAGTLNRLADRLNNWADAQKKKHR